ncbi:hypothetical protein CEXT_622851 [Caerostris extrusa]|uniref:Uncharacterized protein n=1 Tax=Caerostris extrusa TaxID=172846 RepID=A0AAV4XCJ7_CAEEX|nr:hypothetical protein CEXT_622851 [Caerostris extrusa]
MRTYHEREKKGTTHSLAFHHMCREGKHGRPVCETNTCSMKDARCWWPKKLYPSLQSNGIRSSLLGFLIHLNEMYFEPIFCSFSSSYTRQIPLPLSGLYRWFSPTFHLLISLDSHHNLYGSFSLFECHHHILSSLRSPALLSLLAGISH